MRLRVWFLWNWHTKCRHWWLSAGPTPDTSMFNSCKRWRWHGGFHAAQ